MIILLRSVELAVRSLYRDESLGDWKIEDLFIFC